MRGNYFSGWKRDSALPYDEGLYKGAFAYL